MNPFKKAALAIFSIGVAMLAACTSSAAMGNADEQLATGAAFTGYKLGTGDELKVTVFGEPDLSGAFVVDGQGTITMSLIGQVEIVNLTVTETSRRLEERLQDGWLRDPQGYGRAGQGPPLLNSRRSQQAGRVSVRLRLTVMNAIASAGDFTYRADKVSILIKSADSPNEREVDLTPDDDGAPRRHDPCP
jgi:protein involved in polysaccharide export with SLBB domain